MNGSVLSPVPSAPACSVQQRGVASGGQRVGCTQGGRVVPYICWVQDSYILAQDSLILAQDSLILALRLAIRLTLGLILGPVLRLVLRLILGLILETGP